MKNKSLKYTYATPGINLFTVMEDASFIHSCVLNLSQHRCKKQKDPGTQASPKSGLVVTTPCRECALA